LILGDLAVQLSVQKTLRRLQKIRAQKTESDRLQCKVVASSLWLRPNGRTVLLTVGSLKPNPRSRDEGGQAGKEARHAESIVIIECAAVG
jgi:hypothetical protein